MILARRICDQSPLLLSLRLMVVAVTLLLQEAPGFAAVTLTCTGQDSKKTASKCLNCAEEQYSEQLLYNAFQYATKIVPSCPSANLEITDVIYESDIDYLKAVDDVLEKRTKLTNIELDIKLRGYGLNSAGGNVLAALTMGEYIYQHRLFLNVERCYSACVLLLAAGHLRLYGPKSDVRIHRLFPKDVNQLESYDQLSLEENRYYEQIKSYVTKYGVSAELVERMRTTASSELKRLPLSEL
jgi:hypothetical protein